MGPAPERKRNTTWAQFIRRHKEVLWATDFFTAEVWTATGLTTFYVLFFLHLQTRRVILGGITPFPNGEWLKQVARNLTVDDGPVLSKNSSEAEEEWNCDVRLPINKLIRPEFSPLQTEGSIRRRKRLGELLNYYYREAA